MPLVKRHLLDNRWALGDDRQQFVPYLNFCAARLDLNAVLGANFKKTRFFPTFPWVGFRHSFVIFGIVHYYHSPESLSKQTEDAYCRDMEYYASILGLFMFI